MFKNASHFHVTLNYRIPVNKQLVRSDKLDFHYIKMNLKSLIPSKHNTRCYIHTTATKAFSYCPTTFMRNEFRDYPLFIFIQLFEKLPIKVKKMDTKNGLRSE